MCTRKAHLVLAALAAACATTVRAQTNGTASNGTVANQTNATVATVPEFTGNGCSPKSPSSGVQGCWPLNIDASLKGPYTYKAYTPGELVQYYHDQDFPNMTDTAGEETQEYAKGVVMGGIVFLAFGLFGLILYGCWSCAQMRCCVRHHCCCALCCGRPFQCCSKHPMVRTVFLLIGLGLGVAILSVSSVGLDNESDQSEAIEDMGNILQVVVDWSDYTTVELGKTDDMIIATSDATTALTNYPYKSTLADGSTVASVIRPYGTTISDAMNTTQEQIQKINETAQTASSDIKEMQVGMRDTTTSFNAWRSFCVEWSFIVVIILIFTSCFLAFLKWMLPQCCGKKMSCLWSLFQLLYWVILLVCFICCVVLFVLTIVMADFCYDADTNFVSALGLKEGDTFRYYIECDTDGNITNPFYNQSQEVQIQLAQAQTQLNQLTTVQDRLREQLVKARTFETQAQGRGLPYDPLIVTNYEYDLGNLTDKSANVRTRVTSLQATIGQGLTDQGFQVGLLSVVHCYALNLRYQAVIWQTCDTVYNPMAKSMQYCLTIFVLLVVVDWVRRWLRPTQDEMRTNASTFATKNRKDKGYLGKKFKARASDQVHPSDEPRKETVADLASIIVQSSHAGAEAEAEAGAGATGTLAEAAAAANAEGDAVAEANVAKSRGDPPPNANANANETENANANANETENANANANANTSSIDSILDDVNDILGDDAADGAGARAGGQADAAGAAGTAGAAGGSEAGVDAGQAPPASDAEGVLNVTYDVAGDDAAGGACVQADAAAGPDTAVPAPHAAEPDANPDLAAESTV